MFFVDIDNCVYFLLYLASFKFSCINFPKFWTFCHFGYLILLGNLPFFIYIFRKRKTTQNTMSRNTMIRKRSSKAISDSTNSSRILIPNTTRTRGAILFFFYEIIYMFIVCVYCSCTARVLFRVGTPHSSVPLRITSLSVSVTTLLMRVQYL